MGASPVGCESATIVKLLWSGMTQSSVTMSAPLAGFRAIAAGYTSSTTYLHSVVGLV